MQFLALLWKGDLLVHAIGISIKTEYCLIIPDIKRRARLIENQGELKLASISRPALEIWEGWCIYRPGRLRAGRLGHPRIIVGPSATAECPLLLDLGAPYAAH